MRELTADMFVSLDGFAAGADGGQSWTFGYFGPEFAAYAPPPDRVPARARAGRPGTSLHRLPRNQPCPGQHRRPRLTPGGLRVPPVCPRCRLTHQKAQDSVSNRLQNALEPR